MVSMLGVQSRIWPSAVLTINGLISAWVNRRRQTVRRVRLPPDVASAGLFRSQGQSRFWAWKGVDPVTGADVDGNDALGSLGGHFLDVHTAVLAANEGHGNVQE